MFTPLNPQFRVIGNIGVAWGHDKVELKPKDGPTQIYAGRYTFVYTKADGKWVRVVAHASPEPTAPAIPLENCTQVRFGNDRIGREEKYCRRGWIEPQKIRTLRLHLVAQPPPDAERRAQGPKPGKPGLPGGFKPPLVLRARCLSTGQATVPISCGLI